MGNKMGFQYLAFQQKKFISKPIVLISNEISSMVLQLNLEHYEFSSSNLDLEKISYLKKKKKVQVGYRWHVRRERVGCISNGAAEARV